MGTGGSLWAASHLSSSGLRAPSLPAKTEDRHALRRLDSAISAVNSSSSAEVSFPLSGRPLEQATEGGSVRANLLDDVYGNVRP